MNVIEIILCGLLAVVIIAAICNLIRVLRLEQSIPTYRIDPIRPMVTVYTYEDGPKVYENRDGSVEVEPPT